MYTNPEIIIVLHQQWGNDKFYSYAMNQAGLWTRKINAAIPVGISKDILDNHQVVRILIDALMDQLGPRTPTLSETDVISTVENKMAMWMDAYKAEQNAIDGEDLQWAIS